MKQTFKVYRLEFEDKPNKDSKIVRMGCYIHNDYVMENMWWYDEMLFEHGVSSTHPSIWDDGLRVTDNFFCGFDSVEKLQDWFGKYLKFLIDWGLVVREYTLNDVYVTSKSGKQVMFAEHTVIDSKIILVESLVD